MEKHAVLSFAIAPLENGRTLTPVLSGTPLTELIAQFEREHGFDPAGGYGGLIPESFAYGPLDRYFMGESADSYWEGEGGYYLLGCHCGEVGCWPLIGQIMKTGNTIVWNAFKQPHRPNRDYSSFGPFTFDAEQYKSTVAEIASQFRST